MLRNLFKSRSNGYVYPEFLKIERRKVKWARIQVYTDGQVRMVVPWNFSATDIQQFYHNKMAWIEAKRSQFQRPGHEVLGTEDGQLLLFGRGYDWLEQSVGREGIDHINATIHSRKNLVQMDVQVSWYRNLAKDYLARRIHTIAIRDNFRFKRLFIRGQKTRWGSCSSDKNISLNWKLVKAPVFVSDYVILHELAHTKIMNHSPKFWQLVAALSPDFKQAKAWLREHGPYL